MATEAQNDGSRGLLAGSHRQVIIMHYDLYPVEWSAELRVQEALRRAGQRRLVRQCADARRCERLLWLAARLQSLADWLRALVEESSVAHSGSATMAR
jgi:hypothetical protein